jgi:hypothetical protein
VDDDEVVVVDEMNVHASERPRLGAHDVPLNRVDRQLPLLAKDLGQGTALVDVRAKRAQLNSCG